MSRFQLLEILAKAQSPVPIRTLQTVTRNYSKSSADSVRVQLNRMHRWGLISRKRIPWSRGFFFGITMKGRERLIWARKKGLV